MRILSALLALMTALSLCALPALGEEAEAPVVVLRVADYGDIYLELDPDAAPVTTANFLKLVDSGFYNGLTFHRIISGFMAQGGDPLGNGTGGSGENIRGEFSANGFDNPISHERGVISMARSSAPDSASSQFFIMHAQASHLDGSYAAFGRVIAGMGTVDSMCLNAFVVDSNGTVPAQDQPVITEAARADRAEALAAAEREAQNGCAGGVFDDPASGLSFPVPEGFALKESANGAWAFSDGNDTFTLSASDYWRRLGKSAREQYAANGIDRDALTTERFTRAGLAGVIGAAEEDLREEEVNGVLWLGAAVEHSGKTLCFRIGALKGTVIMFAAPEGPALEAVENVLTVLTVE